MKRYSLGLLLVGLISAGQAAEPTDKLRKHVGSAFVDYVQRAEKAEAFRVGKLDHTTAGAEGTVAAREIVGKPTLVDKDTRARLVAVLLADDTYFRGDSKGSSVGVGYRLWTDKKECVEVSCCLSKGNVWITVKDATGKVVAQGDRRGFRDDQASPMRVLAAELFPDDRDVQKFKPKAAPDPALTPADGKPGEKSAGGSKASPFEPGSKVQKVAEGFSFTEGPTADKDGNVYFTDQPSDRILKWSVADGKVTTFLEKSGRANGLCFDAEGKLWSCSDEKNELWKIDVSTKDHEVVVKDHKGKLLNGPNDVWVAPNGGAYFTDPFYKRKWWTRGPEEQDKRGVYLVTAKGVVSRVADVFQQPNGVVGTPDGRTLYVADVKAKQTLAFDVRDDGSLANRRKFCDSGSDGMTLDVDGNVYLTGTAVTVFDKSGTKIAEVPVPEQPSNVCFGGKGHKTLFITARTSVYSIPARVAGGARQ